MKRVAGAVSLVMVLAACGSAEPVSADGAWARTSPAMASAGAVYMNLTSEETDRLIGASVDSSVAGTTEVHETVEAQMAGDGEGGGMEGMGAMTMQEVESIELLGGDTVRLEPGGYHIMLLDLVEPLEIGDTFDVTLDFETADDVVVTVEVRDSAP